MDPDQYYPIDNFKFVNKDGNVAGFYIVGAPGRNDVPLL
jgi:hypothetical protein